MHTDDLLNELLVYQPKNSKKRFGTKGDGGYVVVDNYKYDYYIGCGVGYDTSFDQDFLNEHKSIFGLVFDGNINYIPNFLNKINYVKKNIGIINDNTTSTLNFETEEYQNIFLKMDIDGNEWNWINCFQNMDNVKQLVIEVHDLFFQDFCKKSSWNESAQFNGLDVYSALKKLNKTHYLVHFHSNSCAEYSIIKNKEMPTVAELTYIRKKDSDILGFNETELPIDGLDYVNGYDRKDLVFDYYPFCQKKEL